MKDAIRLIWHRLRTGTPKKSAIRHIWDLLHTGTPEEQEFARAYLRQWGSESPKDKGWYKADWKWTDYVGDVYASRGLCHSESEDFARKFLEGQMGASTQLGG